MDSRLGLSPTSVGPTWLVFPSISCEAPGGSVISGRRVPPRLGLSPTSVGPTWLVFPSISREAPGGSVTGRARAKNAKKKVPEFHQNVCAPDLAYRNSGALPGPPVTIKKINDQHSQPLATFWVLIRLIRLPGAAQIQIQGRPTTAVGPKEPKIGQKPGA